MKNIYFFSKKSDRDSKEKAVKRTVCTINYLQIKKIL